MLTKIAAAIPDLSRAEKRVATWVVEHPKQATSATLAQIANECGTSEPTVLRFCRRMGMRGFRELGVRVHFLTVLLCSIFRFPGGSAKCFKILLKHLMLFICCSSIVVLQLSFAIVVCNCRVAIVVLQLSFCNYWFAFVVLQLLCCNSRFAIVILQIQKA